MTKEEYEVSLSIIKQKEDSIKGAKTDLLNCFCEDFSEFEIGERVEVCNDRVSEVGIVSSKRTIVRANNTLEIDYKVKKIKKNGEASQHDLWVWNQKLRKLKGEK